MSSVKKARTLRLQKQKRQLRQQLQQRQAPAEKAALVRVLQIAVAEDCPDHLQVAATLQVLPAREEFEYSNRLAAEIGCGNRCHPCLQASPRIVSWADRTANPRAFSSNKINFMAVKEVIYNLKCNIHRKSAAIEELC